MNYIFVSVLISSLALVRSSIVVSRRNIQFVDGEASKDTFSISLPEKPTGEVYVDISPREGVYVQPCKVRFTQNDWQNKEIKVIPAFMWNSPVQNQTMTSSINVQITASTDAKFQTGNVIIDVARKLKLAPVCQSTGDPHIVSADGVRFSPQSLGTFTLLNSPEVMIQMRTYQCAKAATCNDGFAIQYKDKKQVFTLGSGNAKGVMEKTAEIEGLTYNGETIRFPNGISLRMLIVTNWKSEMAVKGYVNVYVTIPGNYFKSIDGMCGTFNGIIEDDLTTVTEASCSLFQKPTCPLLIITPPEKPKCEGVEPFPRPTNVRSTTAVVPTTVQEATTIATRPQPFSLDSVRPTPTTTANSQATTSVPAPPATTGVSATTNVPVPPATTEAPVPPATTNVPAPPATTNVPAPPATTNVPVSPATTNVPVPPVTTNVPVPPTTTDVPPPTTTVRPTPPPTETPVNPECRYNYDFAQSYCTRIFAEVKSEHGRKDVFIENCAYDALMTCDLETCAANTFKSFQIRMEIHANVMVQSTDQAVCDEGKKLIETYVAPAKSTDGTVTGNYEVSPSGEKVCKGGYSGLNCSVNLRDLLDKVIQDFSSGERIAMSMSLVLGMQLVAMLF